LDLILVAIVAACASGLTLFSGFGLGTILLPAFAIFFPAPVAVAATGVVHLLNNLFKGTLLLGRADWRVALSFGIPAVPAAILGAWLLTRLGETGRIYRWSMAGHDFGPSGAAMVVGLLLLLFALAELRHWFDTITPSPRLVPLGGVLIGFFGGLTGQQGALRSLFLLRTKLEPARFVATGVIIAVMVDVSRLATYAARFWAAGIAPEGREGLLVLTATLAAFAGAFVGSRWLEKVTIGLVRGLVAAMMLVIGSLMLAGIIG